MARSSAIVSVDPFGGVYFHVPRNPAASALMTADTELSAVCSRFRFA
jgi:hypothetical protein